MSVPPGSKSALRGKFTLGLSLRTKTIIGGGLLSCALISVYLSFVHQTLKTSFFQLQSELSIQRIERVVLQVAQMVRLRGLYAKDNAEWDEAVNFLKGGNPEFLAYNYSSSFNVSGVQMVVVYDSSREVFARQITDRSQPDTFAGIDLAVLAGNVCVVDAPVSGLIRADERCFIVASQPVLNSSREGPSPGWMVFIQPLSADTLAAISEIAGVPIGLCRGNDLVFSVDPSHTMVHIVANPLGLVKALIPKLGSEWDSGNSIQARAFLPSLIPYGDVPLRIDLPRHIFETANFIQDRVNVFAVIGAIIFLIVMLLAFEGLVLKRIVDLDTSLHQLNVASPEEAPIQVTGNDEIGRVAHTTNEIIASLVKERTLTETNHTLLQGVLNSIRECVFAVHPVAEPGREIIDFKIHSANLAAAEIFSLSLEQLPGMCLSQLVGDLRAQTGYPDLLEVLRTGKPIIREYETNMNGRQVWLKHAICPWGDGLVVCFEDISERKNRERVLTETLDEIKRLNQAMLGREDRVIELKKQVNSIRKELGLPALYSSVDDC